MALPDLDEHGQARAENRLHGERIVWLTTVSVNGQPQSSPVGFVWDGASFVIISQPGAPKVANLRHNPRVALHLDLDDQSDDGGVLTVEGTAELDQGPLTGAERSAYLDRYADTMRAQGYTPDGALAEFSTVIHVRPTRARRY